MRSHLPVEVFRYVFVSLFFCLASVSNWIALAYVHDQVNFVPLRDVVYDYIPEQAWAQVWGDVCASVCTVIMVVVAVLHPRRWIVLRRISYIAGWLYMLRSLSVLATYIPPGYGDSSARCRPQLTNVSERTMGVYLDRLVEQIMHLGLQGGSKNHLCGDLLFSGHTIIMVVSTHSVKHYISHSLRYVKYINYFFSSIGIIFMVISRSHYTVDVIIAYWLSSFAFTSYHMMCECEPDRRDESIGPGLWYIKVALWLEKEVDQDKFDRTDEIPIFENITT